MSYGKIRKLLVWLKQQDKESRFPLCYTWFFDDLLAQRIYRGFKPCQRQLPLN